MPVNGVLRRRGIEAWLEDSDGHPIALSEDANIAVNKISTWVNVKPIFVVRFLTRCTRSTLRVNV